ncbi:alpha/beta hydrolase fold domain-containing protein [Streptomyces sp. NPDC059837]|uniref:alpha/beta hydrolase fold domain-containing protein n=1 Tax=Streptomyces sp. NPDC059837 TaxID=3346968 RepID=UPI00366975B7
MRPPEVADLYGAAGDAEVLVVGAGIGGLACAVALSRAGFDVRVTEQAEELREIGAGLQLAPNAVKALCHWGLEEAVAAVSVVSQSVEYFDLDTGEHLFSSVLGLAAAARYGAPVHQIHRADLLGILADVLPAGTVTLGRRATDFDVRDSGVTVRFADGGTMQTQLLVGADGLRSPIRQQLARPEPPRYTGTVGWRGLLTRERAEALGFGHACYCYLGRGRSIVLYWLRSGEVLNVIGFVPVDEIQRESWTESGDVDSFRRSFATAHPRVRRLVGSVESAFITGVYDREPLDVWTDRRVTLLGDAAHPVAPYLAQGAGQAIEDAAVLSAALSAQRGPTDSRSWTGAAASAALTHYERTRRPRTTKLQAVARATESFWHERDPEQIHARNGRFRGITRIDPLGETVWSWLFDYNPVTQSYDTSASRSAGITSSREYHRLARAGSQQAMEAWRGAFTPGDYAAGWKGLRRAYERMLTTVCSPAPGVCTEHVDAGGVPALWVRPQGRHPANPVVVLYLHGGGYIGGAAAAGIDLAARLADAVNGQALAVDYRLAPESPYPSALDDAMCALRWLVERTEHETKIILAGDSAGGALAACAALRARDEELPPVAGVYAMSPLADLSLGSPSIDEREGTDAAVSRDLLTDMSACYLQGRDPQDPYASPAFGEFRGTPPLLVHAAANEGLVNDATRLVERVVATGGNATLRLYDDEVHAFQLFRFSPDAAEALAEFGRFAHSWLNRTAPAG